jgi:hypothetical protein
MQLAVRNADKGLIAGAIVARRRYAIASADEGDRGQRPRRS